MADTLEKPFIKTINRIEFLRKIIVGMLAERCTYDSIERYIEQVNKQCFIEPLAELELISVTRSTFEFQAMKDRIQTGMVVN